MTILDILSTITKTEIGEKTILIILAISMTMSLIFSIFAPIIADKKNRSQIGWFALVYVLGLIPFIILLILKKAPKVKNPIF